jgi:hypothetical protein
VKWLRRERGQMGAPSRPKAKPPKPEELGQRLETLRGLCFCALFDIFSWLAGSWQKVPEGIKEYGLTDLRGIEDPRQRLQYYFNPHVLASWEQALQPFFATKMRVAPELGDSATLREEGLERGLPVKVEMRFTNRSSLVGPGQPRQPLPREDWVLTLWVAADLTRIDDATMRPIAEGE